MSEILPFTASPDSESLPKSVLLAAASAVKASTTVTEPHVPTAPAPHSPWKSVVDLGHRYSLVVFAILFLFIGIAAVKVGDTYWSNHIINSEKAAFTATPVRPTIAGLNLTVPASDLQTKLQAITGQPATLTVGTQTVPIGADTIKSWLQVTSNKARTENYISVRSGTIAASLTQAANRFVKTPINQVTVTEDGVSRVVVGGRNGIALSDPNSLKTQADVVAKTVMNGSGMQFSTPLATQPFQSVTPAAFDKLLVASVTTKKMWAYQGGNQVNSWLVSAGKPSTPTPLGQFRVYAKYSVQDMRGSNPDGTPYFQPHVRWVNYFYQGSAVHGVYWRPQSWFGAINGSHGCIGLPEDQAQWIYNWAPIGTTVIIHA